MQKKLFVTLCFFLLCAPAMAGDAKGSEVPWQKWSSAAFRQAEEQNRLVLLDLSAEWCAFCKKMDLTTWRDPKVLKLIQEHYVPLRIQDEDQPALAEHFRRYGRPGTVIFNGQGEELVSKTGYIKPQWMEWMLQAVAQENNLAAND